MRGIWLTIILAAVMVTLASSAIYLASVQQPKEVAIRRFSLTSSAFRDEEEIPDKYTCEGADISPPLRWEGYPKETISFVLIVEDPDAPSGTFMHWVIYNIPADVNELDEGVPKVERLPFGALQGVNDFNEVGYSGPCPPPGKPHRYVFKMYALDTMLDLEPGASEDDVFKAMSGHILAEATLTGIYSR
ncbi:MAG: YbhB/YbcL family Raf kinase inhibitor-like protein [Aigarchaeota archaeon]|nr:YbhB/YbcL family Raf kinase inhibitor-like protein [Aigarchaeota archaeon]